MPVFSVRAPDGKTYDVEAPADARPEQIYSFVQKQISSTQAPEPRFKQDPVGAFVRGATFRGIDYADAAGTYLEDRVPKWMGGRELKPGEKPVSYNEALKDVSAGNEKFYDDHPILGYGAEFAGGFKNPLIRGAVGLMNKAIDLNKAKMLAQGVISEFPTWGRFGTQGAAAGLAGAPFLARGEDGGLPATKDMVNAAVLTPAGGMAGGSAAPYIAQGVGAVMRGGANVLRPALDRLPQRQQEAWARPVAKRLAADGYATIDDAQAALAKLGPEGTIADLGKGTARLADNMAQTPGKTAQLAEDVLGNRSASMPSRVVSSVKQNISPKGFHNELERLSEAQRTESSPIYKSAFQRFSQLWNDRLGQFYEQPEVKEGIKRGLTVLRREAIARGEKFDPMELGVTGFDDAGEPILSKVPSLRLWDAGKRGIDDMLEAYRDKTTGRLVLDDAGRALEEFRASYVKALDDATGGVGGLYAKARAKWSGPARLKDAMARGRSFVTGDEEVTRKVFNKLTPDEKNAFRVGVGQEVASIVRKNGALPSTLRSVLKDTSVREKLKTILPDEEAFKRFVYDIEKEVKFQNTANSIRGGSPTFQRGAENAAVESEVVADIGGAMISAAQGNAPGAVSQLARYGLNLLRRATVPENVRDQIGKMLLSQDPAEQQAAFEALKQYQTRVPSFTPSNKALMRASRVGSAGGALIGSGSNQ